MVKKSYRLNAEDVIDGGFWAKGPSERVKKCAVNCAEYTARAIEEEDWDSVFGAFVEVCAIQAAFLVRAEKSPFVDAFKSVLSGRLRGKGVRVDIDFSKRAFKMSLARKVTLGIFTVRLGLK